MSIASKIFACSVLTIASLLGTTPVMAAECDNWESFHPEWIWCDGFESNSALKDRYEDVNTTGLARSTADAAEGSASLRQTYTTGQIDAGWVIKVKPGGYPEHIFYRWYHKFGPGYTSFPPKMARSGYRPRNGSWVAVYMVHSWVDNSLPNLDVLANNSSQGPWLPIARSNFDLSQNLDKWVSYEVEVKLNTPGRTDGHYRLWINNILAIERNNVDLRGNTADKINEVMLDTYWNGGATSNLVRYYDNFVISTQKIGPIEDIPAPNSPPLPPGNPSVKKLP